MQILKLLEEGKISAEEAERLLEAVGSSSTHDRGQRHKIWSSLEGLPKVISAAFGNSFSESSGEEFHKYPSKRKIKFKGISGNVTIEGGDTQRIDIQKDGFAKIKESEDSIAIKALSGNVKITVPRKTDLSIAGISGDIVVSNIDGNLAIESVSGDVIGKNLSGSLSGGIVSGDMDLDYAQVDKISIRSRSGNVVLRLDQEVEAEIEIEAPEDCVTCDFELKNKQRDDNVLIGTINKPGAKIEIRGKSGEVEIKKRS
jgi:DUF4097 and DUF4098 domain-containing protein YvlB